MKTCIPWLSWITVLLMATTLSCIQEPSSEILEAPTETEDGPIFFDLPGKMTFEQADQDFDGEVAPDKTFGCKAFGARLPTKSEYFQWHANIRRGPSHWGAGKEVITASGLRTANRGLHAVRCLKEWNEEPSVEVVDVIKPRKPFKLALPMTYQQAVSVDELIGFDGRLRPVMPNCGNFGGRLPVLQDVEDGTIELQQRKPTLFADGVFRLHPSRQRGPARKAKEHEKFSVVCIPEPVDREETAEKD